MSSNKSVTNLEPMSESKSENKGISFRVSAPGKVILHGEFAVIYGKLAVVASIDSRVYLNFNELDPSTTRNSVLNLDALNVKYEVDMEKLKTFVSAKEFPLSKIDWTKPDLIDRPLMVEIIEQFVKQENLVTGDNDPISLIVIIFLYLGIVSSSSIETAPFTISVRSDVKPGAGTGSSASFAVCVASAFLTFIKLKLPRFKNDLRGNDNKVEIDVKSCGFSQDELDLICRWAYQAECLLHGKPSGIDNTVCTYGSLIQFQIGKPIITSKGPINNLRLLLINTNVQRQTKAQVAKVASLKEEHAVLFEIIMDAIDKATECAIENLNQITQIKLSSGDSKILAEYASRFKTLETMVDINQGMLQAMNLSHPKLEEVFHVLSEYDLHGKLTGAGGGGNAMCYVPVDYPQDKLNRLMDSLKLSGFDPAFVNLGGDGLRLENVD